MESKNLVVLAGDGIGPEVTASALQVLGYMTRNKQIDVSITHAPMGGQAIDETGSPFPDETKELVAKASAVLLGAVGGPKWDNAPNRPEKGLLELRQHLGLYANLRPFEVFKGLEAMSPLKKSRIKGLIIRELTGGAYFGQPRGRKIENGEPLAFDTMIYRRHEIERVARIGFEYAANTGKPLVSVDKANVLDSSKLWRETVIALHEEYPQVELLHRYVDAAAMEMVLRPELYTIVVTENLFGDILSDLAGGLVGSLGLLGSASIKGGRGGPGLYEPVHGSAPDIAGQNLANPVGAMLSLAFMFRWSWDRTDLEDAIATAVKTTLQAGLRTRDLGGDLSTDQFTASVIETLDIEMNRRYGG